MNEKVTLPPVRINGTYYTLTYSTVRPQLSVEINSDFYFGYQGMRAQRFIDQLHETNGYDTMVSLLEYHRLQSKALEKYSG